MKKSLSMLFVSTLMLSSAAQATITINLPSNTEPLLLNAVEIKDLSLNADNGVQQIVFKYLGNYRQQGQTQRFTSDPVIVTFNGQNNDYTIKLPPINSSKDATKFNQAPNIMITDNDGKSIEYRVDTLTKDGLQFGRNYQQELEDYNLTARPAVVTLAISPKPSSVKTEKIVTSDKTDNIEQIDIGKMLDFWYQQADQETRKAFKKRINAQK
ncbi:YccT family protein [Shewanella psychrotolerans]|uniref:YccT family protein n=1 Tax=Shewanella psychrotolerans TaxID=2864206 RepID=UPI001C658D86|nr:DUF2057 domain-containing protein [Shewanella psychrotolerans]QYK02818.1 DUF2057 domain-containing protein [Shewanella psychrotolerans]